MTELTMFSVKNLLELSGFQIGVFDRVFTENFEFSTSWFDVR